MGQSAASVMILGTNLSVHTNPKNNFKGCGKGSISTAST